MGNISIYSVGLCNSKWKRTTWKCFACRLQPSCPEIRKFWATEYITVIQITWSNGNSRSTGILRVGYERIICFYASQLKLILLTGNAERARIASGLVNIIVSNCVCITQYYILSSSNLMLAWKLCTFLNIANQWKCSHLNQIAVRDDHFARS
jgi:hypothetical protein